MVGLELVGREHIKALIVSRKPNIYKNLTLFSKAVIATGLAWGGVL